MLAAGALTVAGWAFVSFTPVLRDWLFGDARFYENWGNWITNHQLPYRDFRIEYPPGALPTFVVPVYLKKLAGYHGTYFFWLRIEVLVCMLLALVAMAWALDALGASRRRAFLALCAAGIAPVLLGPTAWFHYDAFPAMLAAFAVAALVAGRGVLACALAAAGAVAKIYPILIVPFALFELWRRGRWRAVGAGVGAALAVIVVCVAPFVALAPDGVRWALHRQLNRPLEIESIGAAFFHAAHLVVGTHLHVVAAAGSRNLGGGAEDTAATVLGLVTVVALVAVYALYLRSGRTREDLVVGCAAAVTAYIAFSKVFSPQYLVWLIPLVPLLGGRRGVRATALLLVILGVTQLWEPYRQGDLWALSSGYVEWLVVVRNLLVLGLLALLVLPERRLD